MHDLDRKHTIKNVTFEAKDAAEITMVLNKVFSRQQPKQTIMVNIKAGVGGIWQLQYFHS